MRVGVVRAWMLGPALALVAAAVQPNPTPLMSLPLEDITCLEREPPKPLPRARVCLELGAIPGMECWPDLPASTPQSSGSWTVRTFVAGAIADLIPPSATTIDLPEHRSLPIAGHARLPDEPPRA